MIWYVCISFTGSRYCGSKDVDRRWQDKCMGEVGMKQATPWTGR